MSKPIIALILLAITLLGCGEETKNSTDTSTAADLSTSADTSDTLIAADTLASDTSAQGDTSEEDTSEGDTSQGDTSQGDTSQGDTSQGDTSQGDTSQGDTSQGDTSCVSECDGRACGDDGCGGQCGECTGEATCDAGLCIGVCPTDCTTDCPQGCYALGECVENNAPTLELHPNVYTAGVIVGGAGAGDGAIFYRRSADTHWRTAHPPARLSTGELGGSLFFLEPNTDYDLRVDIGGTTACGQVQTLPVDPVHETLQTLFVDAAATAGGDGTEASPFQSIQSAIDSASAGTDIAISPGLYRESLSIDQRGGEAGLFIRLLGAPGATLDGSDEAAVTPNWEVDSTSTYRTPWGGAPVYLNRDGLRQYHYLSLAGLRSGIGDDGEMIDEGFFVEGGYLYIRSLEDPAGFSWQIPSLGTAIALDGAAWIWIEGLEIRYYGEGSYPKGIDVRDSDHVVVRKNNIYGTPSPLWVRRGSNHVRIEENTIHQSNIPNWPWPAVKGTDHENSAISLAGGRGAIAANNTIYDIFNGVITGSFGDPDNTQLARDVDVYRNRMRRVTDDGLEPEGACINNRFWGNSIDEVHNGISLAPITVGPVWVLRNRFTDYDESGFKLSNDSSGPVFLYHNTCFTDRPDQNGMGVSGLFENMVFRNNIIHGTSYSIEMSRPALPNDLDYDNLFTTRGAPVIKWDNVRYDSLSELCAATGLECNAQPSAPGLDAPSAGRFALTSESPNIDAALLIPGINDAFTGEAPDIGYLEFGAPEPPVIE